MFVVGASQAKVIAPDPVTVSVAVPDMLPDVAVIVVDPVDNEVANPFETAALLIAAIAAFDELQVTDAVRFCVEPSE